MYSQRVNGFACRLKSSTTIYWFWLLVYLLLTLWIWLMTISASKTESSTWKQLDAAGTGQERAESEPPWQTSTEGDQCGHFFAASKDLERPLVVITPTYARPTQMAGLVTLRYLFQTIPSIHWILIEDSPSCNPQLTEMLKSSHLSYSHLVASMPAHFRKMQVQPRGVSGREAGMRWALNHFDRGVIYFADDDNVYTTELFQEINSTKVVSVFPVGLVGRFAISSPIVQNGTVVGFFDSWLGNRKFALDMAGFAVDLQFLRSCPNARMPYIPGYEEDGFLRSLGIELNDLEPKADNCTRILVWHTKNIHVDALDVKTVRYSNATNMHRLLMNMKAMSMATS